MPYLLLLNNTGLNARARESVLSFSSFFSSLKIYHTFKNKGIAQAENYILNNDKIVIILCEICCIINVVTYKKIIIIEKEQYEENWNISLSYVTCYINKIKISLQHFLSYKNLSFEESIFIRPIR